MQTRVFSPVRPTMFLAWWMSIFVAAAAAQGPAQTPAVSDAAQESAAIRAMPAPAVQAAAIEKSSIVHTLKIAAPSTHVLEIESAVPTDGHDSIELMMARWTPGFYRMDNYAGRVLGFSARLPDGTPLTFEKITENRWRIDARGEPVAIVSYRLLCDRGSVSRSYVGDDYAVICGGPTFLTLVDDLDRPHEVHLEFPSRWGTSATGLPMAPDGYAHHYRAENFDILIDSPIAIGNPSIHTFTVADSRHHLVDLGSADALANWNGAQAASDLEKIVGETARFWGFLPFDEYYFLNKFGQGGGGLEHVNSMLIHSSPPQRRSAQTSPDWLNFVSHEYFHAFNVKRLRPVELGPFDYENARRTSGLWVAEGLTNYFNSLLVARAGLATPEDYLGTLSEHIRTLQNSAGRLAQSLAAASLETWSGSGFGGGRGRGQGATRGQRRGQGRGRGRGSTISYYTKGPVVGFLLDAKIRRATDGQASLDDVMRRAYRLYSGERGYTEEEFRQTAEDVARIELDEWFQTAVDSTEELDYSEALDWFGLRFAPSEGDTPSWRLEVLPDASDEQKARFAAFLELSNMHVTEMAYVAPEVTPEETDAAEPTNEVGPVNVQPPLQQPLVVGLGGVFIFSTDAAGLARWYERNLGLRIQAQNDGAFVCEFVFRKHDAPDVVSRTVWAILPTREVRNAASPRFQINYRVKSMDETLAHLRAGGVAIEGDKSKDYPYGRFAWVLDPDGNRVELFEEINPPAATPQN